MKGFTTKAIHTPAGKKDPYGALQTPIYGTAAYEFETSEDLALAFQGKKPAHVYSRSTNPTVEHLENRVRNMTGAFSVIALSSGMAAISNLIMALGKSGDNVVASKFVFGNTYSLFEKTLKPWGLEGRYIDFTDLDALEKVIDENTAAVFLETITNPQMQVADLKAVADIAHSKNVPVIVDSTATPFVFYNAKEVGIDLEVISSTKYISGGGTSIGGLIIEYGIFNWAKNNKLSEDVKKFGPFTLFKKLRSEVYRNLGACESPFNAYLQCLGLETLALRVDASCKNAQAVAEHLEKHPKVKAVGYPGLSSSPYYERAKNQFGSRFGGILTFNLGSEEECMKFMDALKVIRRGTNLNDNKSMIIHPGSTIFCEFSDELKDEMGVPKTLIRLAVGIEDLEDLIDDIDAAFNAI